MALDFQQVRKQIQEMGENAPIRQQILADRRSTARSLLEAYSAELQQLRYKVQRVVSQYDPNLRCALPVDESVRSPEGLLTCVELPPLPRQAAVLAADGSQIAPDRHQEVNYCLINVGAIQMIQGASLPPVTTTDSRLLYDEDLYTAYGRLTDDTVALQRDLNERKILAILARDAPPPVITFTDGPMELWGVKEGDSAGDYRQSLEAYKSSLSELCELDVATAGYVDKPAADLVVRLLEVAAAPETELADIKKNHPLRGVTDIELYTEILEPGERSAVFAIQSKSAANYQNQLALHFFYLNVGRVGKPWLARVEIPAWVAARDDMLNQLHAVLVHQSRIMGTRPYPYLLHRAHEAAVVSLQEKEQVTQMILYELRQQGVPVGQISNKQAAKNLGARSSFQSRLR
jgi:hypothetical protein